MADQQKHPSHKTRFSDSSFYDEVGVNCGATDNTGNGWGRLAEPCVNGRRDETHEDYLGRCEGCDRLLFVGDAGLRCDDGPLLCAEHAPSWAEAKHQWDAGEQLDDDPERRAAFMKSYAAHIAAGGAATDKFTCAL